jgi:hypothetical protein
MAPPTADNPYGHDPQLLDALSHLLTQYLQAPEPQAPTPPTFRGLSGRKALLAGLGGPNVANILIQKQMGPAQAQYEQQKAAFEQAMAGRHAALQTALGLTGQESKADIARETDERIRGQNAIVDELRRQGLLNQEQRTRDAEEKAKQAPKPRYEKVDLPGGKVGAIDMNNPFGASARPIPGAVHAASDRAITQKTNEDQVFSLIDAMEQLHPATKLPPGQTPGFIGGLTNLGKEALSHVPGSGALPFESDVRQYNALRNDLGNQWRAAFGAQGVRAWQDISRLIDNIGSFSSTGELAHAQFERMRNIARATREERRRQYPALYDEEGTDASGSPSVAAPSPSGTGYTPSPEAQRLLDQFKANERKRRGG